MKRGGVEEEDAEENKMEEAKKKGKRMRKSRTDISDIEYVSANRKRWLLCVCYCV